MLKKVIERELRAQNADKDILLDGICTQEEFFLWEQEEDPGLWLMQIHAISQRLGKSVDKYDVVLDEEEFLLALRRSKIWRKIRRGELCQAEASISEYKNNLQKLEKSKCKEGMPDGERALQRQFLALARAEIARRKAAPYAEQMEIVLDGLKQTVTETAWERRRGKRWPSLEWFKTRRLHLMEQFLLARFARLYECMGQKKRKSEEAGEEAFVWYQELAGYIQKTAKDRADVVKIYPLLCYRMAANRLRRIFGEDAWREEDPCFCSWGPVTFAQNGREEQEEFRYAQEYMRILGSLTEGLTELGLSQKNYPLFRKMEYMRLALLRKMPLFGEHTAEEHTWRALEGAWEALCFTAERGAAGKAKAKGKEKENITIYAAAAKEEDQPDRADPAKSLIFTAQNFEMDNLEPDYMERSMHNFRELLGRRMQLHGWDIYELGDTIYVDPGKSLLPILKGKAKPKPKKRRALQERLGMSWEKFDPGFLTREDAEYKKYARMMRAYYDGRIEEGRKLLEELEEKMNWEYVTNEQFGKYWDALFLWKSGKITEEEKNEEMWKILEYSGVKREKFMEVGGDLTKTEWRALIEIAWNWKGEDTTFLCQVLKKQKEYLEESEKAGLYPEYYIKLLYCLSSMEREMGNLDEAERYADEGLKTMYEMNLYTQWGALFFVKFRIVEDRKDEKMEEGDFDYIRQAYAVEKLFLKSNTGYEAIEEYLEERYGQDILADMKGKA